ncbi:TPA: YdfR family protein [Escherichia coli]|nr:YdfR family protein [Escherichia coli]HBC1102328.1 YdfR family protein [Escherichia coli]
MKKKYELVVKGINNYPDKITVTVVLEIGGYPSLLLPNVAISLDRTEGATLEFYEAEAKKQAKQFFMDVAAGLCEGNEPLPEKRPIILEAQDVLITYKGKLPGRITDALKMPPSTLRSEKEASCLQSEYSITVKSAGEEGNKRYFIASAPDKDQEWECNRPSFVVYGDGGKITISENGKLTPPSHQHSEALIEFAIDYLKNNKKQGLMKRIGRCMGYLQVAAEIEMMASGADNDAVVLEALLRDFDNTPFKKAPVDWMQPGMTYLKGRI